MKNFFLTVLFTFFVFNIISAQTEELVKLDTGAGELEGTLLLPENMEQGVPVALIIAGSGPTDRDGNSSFTQNNSLKLMTSALAGNGIASLRFDKRGVGASKNAAVSEIDLRFEHYIDDAVSWIEFLNKDKRFGKFVVIGHSEGSLVGIVAAQKAAVDKFVSIAGVGRPASDILSMQFQALPEPLRGGANSILEKLVKGEKVDEVPPMLNPYFRPSVQPYLISWFKYNPVEEITKLNIPVLIVQGTTDLQVGLDDADLLSTGAVKSEKIVIDGMNHILKEAPMDRQLNMKTYVQSDLSLHPDLIIPIVDFIKK